MLDTGTYGAFGNLIGSTGSTNNSYGFAGEQFDSGLDQYYLRARYYDQSSGRFTRRDDYEGRLGEPLTLHKYLYGNSNPILYTDPSGLLAITDETERRLLEMQLQTQQVAQLVPKQQIIKKQILLAAVATLAGVIGTSISIARALNEQFRIPVVFWGNDLPETTDHQFRSVTGSGYTIRNPNGELGQSSIIIPVLHRRENEYPRRWRYSQPQSIGRSQSLGLDVDEFPYAITEEGGQANYLKGKVSLHVLSASQNRSNGRRLLTFMNRAYITPREDNPIYSVFLNIPVPFLSISFGLDRNARPVSVYDGN